MANKLESIVFRFTEQLALESPKERNKMDEERKLAERKIQEERMREEQIRRSEEMKAERKVKRQKVINELIQTEKDFLTSLNLIMETFQGPKAEKVFVFDFYLCLIVIFYAPT